MYSGERRKGREATHYKDLFLFFFKAEVNVALYSALCCAWELPQKWGALGLQAPRGCCCLMTVWAREAEAGLLAGPSRHGRPPGPSRAAGQQYGQLHPVPVGQSEGGYRLAWPSVPRPTAL